MASAQFETASSAGRGPADDKSDRECLADQMLQAIENNRIATQTLGLSLSHSCPARCAHCICSCLPGLTQPAAESDLVDWLTQASETGRYHTVNVTGGEPFDHPDALLQIVARCRLLGLRSTVVTSAIWATDVTKAQAVLSPVVAEGLAALFVSVDDFHLRRVPLRNVGWALAVAAEVGMKVGIATVWAPGLRGSDELVEALGSFLPGPVRDSLQVESGTLVFSGRAGRLRLRRSPDLPASCALCCTGRGPVIHENGAVSACCGPDLAPASPLLLGNLHDESFLDIDDRYLAHAPFAMIRLVGLRQMLDAAMAAGVKGLEGWVGAPDGEACNLCQALITDRDALAAILEDPSCRRATAERALLREGNPWWLLRLNESWVPG